LPPPQLAFSQLAWPMHVQVGAYGMLPQRSGPLGPRAWGKSTKSGKMSTSAEDREELRPPCALSSCLDGKTAVSCTGVNMRMLAALVALPAWASGYFSSPAQVSLVGLLQGPPARTSAPLCALETRTATADSLQAAQQSLADGVWDGPSASATLFHGRIGGSKLGPNDRVIGKRTVVGVAPAAEPAAPPPTAPTVSAAALAAARRSRVSSSDGDDEAQVGRDEQQLALLHLLHLARTRLRNHPAAAVNASPLRTFRHVEPDSDLAAAASAAARQASTRSSPAAKKCERPG